MQFLQRDRADAPKHADIERMQKLDLAARWHLEDARTGLNPFSGSTRLGELSGEFCDELRRGDSHAAR